MYILPLNIEMCFIQKTIDIIKTILFEGLHIPKLEKNRKNK